MNKMPSPGLTNRLLAKYAQAVLQGFPNAFNKNITAQTIGNPIRREISAILPPQQRLQGRKGPLRLLIIGGSRGAHHINQILLRALNHYPNRQALAIWHQTGKSDFAVVQKEYSELNMAATVTQFIDDMPRAYEWADLAICRAGALTVSEIATVGLPSVLIPFPYAVDDHQYANGHYLAAQGGAELIREQDLSHHKLIAIIDRYINNRSLLIDMAQNAQRLAKPQALSAIVDVCAQLAR